MQGRKRMSRSNQVDQRHSALLEKMVKEYPMELLDFLHEVQRHERARFNLSSFLKDIDERLQDDHSKELTKEELLDCFKGMKEACISSNSVAFSYYRRLPNDHGHVLFTVDPLECKDLDDNGYHVFKEDDSFRKLFLNFEHPSRVTGVEKRVRV